MEKNQKVANKNAKVNVYEQTDDFKNVTGFSTCMEDEDGRFFDEMGNCSVFGKYFLNGKYYLNDKELDSIKEVEVGGIMYSTVPGVDFTLDEEE